MRRSKLISLLQTFTGDEWRAFEDYVASPYFNKREELVPLLLQLKELAPDFPPDRTRRKRVFRAAFPGSPYDEKEMAYLMSYLLRLGEEFLGRRVYERSEVRTRLDILSVMVDRRLDKHYHFHLKKSEALLAEDERESSERYWYLHRLAEVKNRHFTRQDQRRFDRQIQTVTDQLDQFYFNKKLRLLCELVNRQRIFQKSYDLRFLDEVMACVRQSDFLSGPGARIYYHILRMLLEEEPERHFQSVISLFRQHFEKFPQEDKRNILSHALNFCIRQIRVQTDKHAYMEEALQLYTFGIEQKIFLDRGHLSPWHFKNVIKLAFNLKRHDWAEEFIQTYSQQLPEDARENALYYNLADLYYQRGDYDEALRHLNRVAFTDVHYQLNAKTLLLKIFYELGEEEALLSTLAAFTIALKRNKNISADLRKTYQNFCSLLSKSLRRNPKKLARLEEDILSTSPLTSREWLLSTLKKQQAGKGI